MKKIHFFTDADKLNPQTAEQAYYPVMGNETSQYRVTSLHTAQTKVNAYAVCEGTVWFQYAADGLLNVILKPTMQPEQCAYHIRYYIYKGISPFSVIDKYDAKLIQDVSYSGNEKLLLGIIKKSQTLKDEEYDRVNNNPKGTTHNRVSINALGLNLTSSSDHKITDDDPIEKAFGYSESIQFPYVSAGANTWRF